MHHPQQSIKANGYQARNNTNSTTNLLTKENIEETLNEKWDVNDKHKDECAELNECLNGCKNLSLIHI